MSTSQTTGSSNRPSRHGASHRHSKSTSTIPSAPKRQSNRQHSSHYHQRQVNQSPTGQRKHFNSHSDNENGLVQVRSDPMPPTVPITPPRHSNSAKSPHQEHPSTEKKKRRRQQKRPKDLNTAAAKADMGNQEMMVNIPPMPQTAKPFGTPGKHYAGPTFHHSPAPSALPLPSFFSKSVPSTPNGPSLSTMMTSSEESDSDSTPSVEEKKDESPLAKLFRADSEERAAKLRAERRERLEGLVDDNPFKSRSANNLPYSDVDSSPGTPGRNGGVDLVFAMDSVDKNFVASPIEHDANVDIVRKRKEKAMALKEMLLQHEQMPLSPTPKSRYGGRQSPEYQRIPVKTQSHPPAKGYTTPTKGYGMRSTSGGQIVRQLSENIPASESPKSLSRSNSQDPKIIEDYLRWALKIDTPSAPGVRG